MHEIDTFRIRSMRWIMVVSALAATMILMLAVSGCASRLTPEERELYALLRWMEEVKP